MVTTQAASVLFEVQVLIGVFFRVKRWSDRWASQHLEISASGDTHHGAMVTALSYTTVESPLGVLLLTSDGNGLTGLFSREHPRLPTIGSAWRRDDAFFTGVRDQLDAYFAGRLTEFNVSLSPVGTPFQHKVWNALREIPFGHTVSYGELALRIGQPAASRAVGLANAKNPIGIIIPCHRVVGTGGKLTGYAGGLAMKQHLLDLESSALVTPLLSASSAPHPRLSV